MMVSHVSIGEVIDNIETWDPRKDLHPRQIDYIDIGSINRDTKQIAEVVKVENVNAPSRARQLVAEGDILVSTVRPNLNAVAVVPSYLDRATASTGFTVLRPNRKIVSGRYLFHWVRTEQFVSSLVRLATGASYPAVTDRIVKESKFPFPSLQKQKRIAEILDKADALRAKRRQTIAKLDKLCETIFFDSIGDPIINSKAWPVLPLADICETTQGIQIPRSEQVDSIREGYKRYLYINDFYAEKDCKYVRNAYFSKEVTENDLVVANTGSPGRVFKGVPGILSNNLFRVSFDTHKVTRDYLFGILSSMRFQNRLQQQMKQGIQSHLGHQTFGRQIIPVPPMSIQDQYQIRISAIEKIKKKCEHSEIDIGSLFHSLQQHAFKGDLFNEKLKW